MSHTVISAFATVDDASNAVSDLEDLGYNPKELTIMMKEQVPIAGESNAAEDTAVGIASGATTGALAGGLIGGLMGLGLSKEDATIYETAIKEGGVVVAVPAKDGQEGQVSDILEEHHAHQTRMIAS